MNTLRQLSVVFLTLAALGYAAAQDQSSTVMSPPKVLTIAREFVKPGKTGSPHDKAESAFVQAARRAKWPTHYLGMNSISGKSRSLFIFGYDSFEAWEKDEMAQERNTAYSAALDRAYIADGELLDSVDSSVLAFDPDYSLNLKDEHVTPATRYFEIAVYHIKQGHRKDWDDGMKMVLAAYQKALPQAHWACYEAVFGAPENTYVFFIPRKSASEIDSDFAHNKDFAEAMGEDGMKKLEDLSAAAIESSETNLFVINPTMSYVPDEWGKADDFWKPKAAGMAAATPKKSAENPAQ